MTLTEFSYNFRRVLPMVILLFLSFLILFYAIKIAFIFIQVKKPIETHVDPVFGKISLPAFHDFTTSENLSFKIDNIEGQPVTATDSAKVFLLPPAAARFGYREKTFLIAQTLGMNADVADYTLKDKQAVLTDSTQKLTVDITNFNFSYQYYFDQNPTLFDNAIIPTSQESQKQAVNFLQTVGRYPDELAQGNINTIFFTYDPQAKTLKQQPDNTQANIAEVDFFRPDIDSYTVVTPRFPNSQNYVLLLLTPSGPKILRSQIEFFEKSDEQVGYYPLRNGDSAYDDLKKGKAIVVSNPENKNNIIIKKMFTAYYDPDIYSDYLEPVYVFLGEGGFVAYDPAVASEYLIK